LVPVEYTPVSLAAHVGGALAGMTIGYVVFSNYKKNLLNEPVFWICLLSFLSCVGFAVFWNVFLSPVGTLF
jgi:rhomboid-related protein 1/2/3